jgi:signal transduction histidine kinase
LLTLARSEQGVTHPESLELQLLARDVLDARAAIADRHGVHVESSLESAAIVGDRQLVERLISNLIDNAIVHNEPGGEVAVRTAVIVGSTVGTSRAVITVINGGPLVAATEVSRLLEPFERSNETRMARREGAGVGLSIVRAIAVAHTATLTIIARPEGGLRVDVGFTASVDASKTVG